MLHVLYELQHLLLLKGHTRVLKRVVGPPIHQPQLISNKNTIFFFLISTVLIWSREQAVIDRIGLGMIRLGLYYITF